MRIPRNLTFNKDNSVIEETITIDEYEKLDYPYIDILEVDDKLINKIIRVLRNSMEYKEYILFLKQELNLNHCSFLTNLDYEEVDIHMHHGPLTIYEIIDIVFRKQLLESNKVSSFSVMEEVMRLHYENRIGLIPISSTVHELVHSRRYIYTFLLFLWRLEILLQRI